MENIVYINAVGKFLPGEPVGNDEMEEYLGMVDGKPSRMRKKMLEQNGIKTRYYAINKQQESLYSAAEMAALAIKDCLQKSKTEPGEVQFLSAGTTQGDMPIPGFASMVHGESGIGSCEIASHQSVCAASLMALQNAYLHVQAGLQHTAVACAADFTTRMFKAQRFTQQTAVKAGKGLAPDTEFLRWMLSDGAGACLLQDEPAADGVCFKIEWIELRSAAHKLEPCMYAGVNKSRDGSMGPYWLDYPTFTQADAEGAINVKQDLRLVDNVVSQGVQHFIELVEQGKINTHSMAWLLCHYSSEYFKQPILNLLAKGGMHIPEEKWFTNLHTKGNTGAASIFIMLEELMYEKDLHDGQEVICMVPESGRFITGFMKLRVIKKAESAVSAPAAIHADDPIIAPQIHVEGKAVQEKLVRGLINVWIDFETNLRNTPFIRKIYNGTMMMEDYKLFLLNLRQQVIDGSQWIARAASNVSMEYFSIRSKFIAHARDEHRDYQILEENYINCGGNKEDLYNTAKNIGSEALSGYMFNKASQPNPFDLLGGMFIIEGLGNRIAGNWGRALKEQLGLRDDQVSFFTYHEGSDSNENHFERFEHAVNSDLLTEDMAVRIIKTARVVARLYVMQIEEMGNY